MADNTTLNAGTGGDVIGSDDIGGVKFQRVKLIHGIDGTNSGDVSKQNPLPVNIDSNRTVSYRGNVSTFRTPGRAGTTGQRIFALHNATGSSVIVDIESINLDMVQTVVKAVTVLPPVIRLYRVTVLPTNGTALTKVAKDTSQSSSSSVTVFGDASADGTSSGTTLTATLPAANVIAQEYAPRLITAVGYEPLDRIEFLDGDDERITLRALEGIVLSLDYTLATQNPVTDMWLVNVKWTEYTAAT